MANNPYKHNIIDDFIFIIYLILFIIPVLLRLCDYIYASNLVAIIVLILLSLYSGCIIKLWNYVLSCEPMSDKAKEIQEKAIKKDKAIPHKKHFNNALAKWSEYNFQVILFSLVIYISQNVDKVNYLNITDINIFWLFIQICLYSTTFSKIKIDELLNTNLSENQKNEVTKIKKQNFIFQIISFIMLLFQIVSIFMDFACICYLNIFSYGLIFFIYSNQFKIELFHATIPILSKS